ncbi:unnamed protein product [Pelagomonas calceolata]|uniref:Tudor domain-containing protein n=1 Tax=Pelagomonas calceolata TaxID=35677 RepID=A0A8J2X472_9STRA|nr:unnamed protein product [Pelagomonas calceolata]
MSTTIPSGTDSEATPGELDAFAQNFFGFDSMAALWQFNWCPWQPALEDAFAYVVATWEAESQAEFHSWCLSWLPDAALPFHWAEYLGVSFTPWDSVWDVFTSWFYSSSPSDNDISGEMVALDHAGDPVVGYVVAVNPDRQTCVVLFGDTSVGRDVSVCSLIVLPTVASEPVADAAALGSSEDLETTRRYQTVGETSVGHDVPSTGLVAKPTAGASGPAADRDAPGSAGDPKETRGGWTPWIFRDAPYLFSRVRRLIVDPETGEPTRVVAHGHVEAYLPASTSNFYDDDGKPAALWRVRFTSSPIKGDSEDLELHEVEEALVTPQSVSADTEFIVRAVRRLDLNDEGADGRVGAVASPNLGEDDDRLRDGHDAALQDTYTGAGHGRAHAGAAGAATSSPGATDAAASNLHRAAAAAAGTGASDAIDADAGTCDADAFWFARAMEPDVDWSSSASLRAFVLKHDVWPCMGHPLREPMLEAIAALEGVNPDITFSDSAALVPTVGAAEGVGVTAAIGTAARSCLDLAYGAASCCASAAFSCCSAAVSYVSDACTCFFGVLPNGAAKTAVDATPSADGAAASETSYPGDGGATAEPGAAVTEAGGVDGHQPFQPPEGEGDEYCETPTKEPAAAATEEPAAANVATGDVAEGRDRAQAETEAIAGLTTLSCGDGAPAMPHDGFVFQTVTERPRRPRQSLALPAPLPPVDGADELQTSFTASDDCADELQCPVLGQCVEVLWDPDGKYYRCKFTAFDGKDVTILYDNGDEETVALAGLVYNPLDSQADVDGAASPSSEESQALERFRLLTKDEKYGPKNRKEVEELAKIQQKLESFLNDENYLLDDLDGFKLGLLFTGGRYKVRCVPEGGGALEPYKAIVERLRDGPKVKSSKGVALSKRPARLAHVLEEAGMDPDTEVTKDNAEEILAAFVEATGGPRFEHEGDDLYLFVSRCGYLTIRTPLRPLASAKTDDDLAYSSGLTWSEYFREARRRSGDARVAAGKPRWPPSDSCGKATEAIKSDFACDLKGMCVAGMKEQAYDRLMSYRGTEPKPLDQLSDRGPEGAIKFICRAVIDGDTIGASDAEGRTSGGHSYYHTMAVLARRASDVEPKLIVRLSSADLPSVWCEETERMQPQELAVAKAGELDDAFCDVEAELGAGGALVAWGGGDRRYLTEHMLGRDEDVVIVDAMYAVRCMLGMTGRGEFPTTHGLALAGATDAFSTSIKFLGEILCPAEGPFGHINRDGLRHHDPEYDAGVALEATIECARAYVRRLNGEASCGPWPPVAPFTRDPDSAYSRRLTREREDRALVRAATAAAGAGAPAAPLTKDEVESPSFTVAKLRAALAARDLPTDGLMAELRARLLEALEEDEVSEDDVENFEPYESESDDSTEEEVGQGIVGDRVEVVWDGDGKYYPGVITACDGEEATILYDNGEEETVALAGLVFNFL